MKELLAALSVALLLTLPARAGTITISVTTGAGTSSFAATVADADLARMSAAYNAALGQICDNATPPVCRNRTAKEILQGWAQGLLSGTMANVASYEKGLAAATATATVQPITATAQ